MSFVGDNGVRVVVFATLAAIAVGAVALESSAAESLAGAAVLARVRGCAFVHFDAAVFAAEAGLASALVIVEQGFADASVSARFRFTVVYLLVAVQTRVAGYAVAFVVVDEVDAGASVPAGVAFAVVDVGFAVFAGEAARAGAFVALVVRQSGAVASVRAWVRRAVIDDVLAFGSVESGRTRAFVSVNGIATGASVLAGFHFARLYGDFAMRTVPSFRAFALVTGSILLTRGSVQARFMRTIAKPDIAIGTGVAGRATTSIRALSGIKTSAAVSARLMIRTIIQILITKQSAPAFVAQAFPRFRACTAYASRILFAFAAQSSFPTDVA